MLAALDLAGADNARGDVGYTHGGGGLVDLLAARAAGAVIVYLEVVGVYLDLNGASISGITSSEAKEVCLLPEESNGEIRTSL